MMPATAQTLLMTDAQVGLATDLYELTMAAGYFENHLDARADFELFVRDLPADRGYLVAAGLEQALAYLQALRFSDEDVAFLRGHESFSHISEGFFDRLRSLRFTGDVWAVPEGTVVFAEEPILRVRAPIIEAQVVETYLLTTLTYQTLVATKASRVVAAAVCHGRSRPAVQRSTYARAGPGKSGRGTAAAPAAVREPLPAGQAGLRGVADFGSRRAHGPQAGLWAARAAYIGGCHATSNVLAGRLLGIPVVGTAAHSWTMAFPTEAQAFQAYLKAFPDSAVLLVDTYDTLEGTRRAIEVAGERLKGVRLDSGDLVDLSRRVRGMLDAAGLSKTRIVASGDLNEYRIAEIVAAGAPIDIFGVGTDLVTSADAPALGGVYKLVAIERDGQWRPCLKQSPGKATWPWAKQVWRRSDAAGRFTGDCVGLADEEQPGTPLLEPVMREGDLVGTVGDLAAARARARDHLARLDPAHQALRAPAPYPLRITAALAASAHKETAP